MSNKPTIFFSHSSKDKDLVVAIKDKLIEYTGSTIDIFVSSDGQSIPFGTNWIHKVEEELNDAKIMFVFVTENSISTGWIYFEAGFAYSKKIQVIPVGIGINVGSLKAPLNMLQGFNIVSEESLNNIITILNRKFDYNHVERFTKEDYNNIIKYSEGFEPALPSIETFVSSLNCRFYSTYTGGAGIQADNIGTYLERIEEYLKKNNLPYSFNNSKKLLLTAGIQFRMWNGQTKNGGIDYSFFVNISSYNCFESLKLYYNISLLFELNCELYLDVSLRQNYSFIEKDEDISAILLHHSTCFLPSRETIGVYSFEKHNLTFRVLNVEIDSRKPPRYVLRMIYDPKKCKAADIIHLISKLAEIGVIHETGENKDA